MSNMKPLQPFKWPGRKEGQRNHDKGRETERVVQARTTKQIQNATPALKAWYDFIEASKQRVP